MPLPPAADVTGNREEKGFYRRKLEWLLSSDHFHFKLLAGTTLGALFILLLAVVCVLVTMHLQTGEVRRARAIEGLRLSSVVERDVAMLEDAYRGYLLSRDPADQESFRQLQATVKTHADELHQLIGADPAQGKRALQARDLIQNWLTKSAPGMNGAAVDPATILPAPSLRQANGLLQEIQKTERLVLKDGTDRNLALQLAQIPNFTARMQRAAANMEKETRGFLLTGDAAFIQSYQLATRNFDIFHGYLSVLVDEESAEEAKLSLIRENLETWITQGAVPDIEARRNGQTSFDARHLAQSAALMGKVRQPMEEFSTNQFALYEARAQAAARQRKFTAWGIDLFCALVTGLLIASSAYSLILFRRQLRKLESDDVRIRSVVEHVLDGMLTIDEKGAIYSMNPAAKCMFGYKNEPFFGDQFVDLIPKYFEREGDGSSVDSTWGRLTERTGRTTFALGQTKAQAVFPVEISLTQMSVEKETYFVATIRDITERKRFEEELAAKKESLAVTLASIGDGVITIDLNGRVVVCNAASEAMTGWPASEAVGQPIKTVFAIAADAAAKGKRAASIGYRSEAEAILLGTPDRATLTSRAGAERLIEQVASPIRNGKNELCGVVLVFRDITDRQRDEAERRKAEALDQLGLLAGGIAHDFNNLLTAIIGNVSLASALLPPNDEMRERLEDARNASFRARDLAQQLLTFARGGAPIKQSASVAHLIQETVSFSLRGSCSRSELAIEPQLWSAEFDPGQISQVIANLVVNADQAMPDGGTLHVSCDNFSNIPDSPLGIQNLPAGDYIRIQLRDEGVGIPPQCLKQIFDPYFTTKPKGNGLGLATTYSVIKNHGGMITVKSEQFCGATFAVYLPAARQPSIAVAPAAPPAQEPMLKGSGRVLVVDDEEAIRMLVDFTLSRLGYEVVAAETALRGIELYREELERGQRFDLVILDLTLPGGMGGKDALKKLIEIDPMVTAVVSSGYATDATMSRYEDYGFRGVIAKPYEAAELSRKVHAVIEASRMNFAPVAERFEQTF